MAMLVGEFELQIDAKHRLAIPAALREQIDPEEDGKDYILVLGPDRHLWLYPDELYRRMLAMLRRSPLPDREAGKTRLLFALARVIKPDKQGRIVLPEKSMQRAVISNQVTLVGEYDHVEIWPAADWEQHLQEKLPTYGEVLFDAADRLRKDLPAD